MSLSMLSLRCRIVRNDARLIRSHRPALSIADGYTFDYRLPIAYCVLDDSIVSHRHHKYENVGRLQ